MTPSPATLLLEASLALPDSSISRAVLAPVLSPSSTLPARPRAMVPAGLGSVAARCKRIADIVAAIAILVACAPVLLIAMIAIQLDTPGPAIFAQPRVGLHGRPFRIFKLRTMVHNPTPGLVWLRDRDGTVAHKIKDDPRVTRVGRWLRRTSIDELPQLLNVIRGEMSLVGPRPELPEIVATYAPWQHERHQVRPGLTGWWQVSGRGDLPMHQNTELDLYYVRHQSLWLDARILIRTALVVFRGFGAF